MIQHGSSAERRRDRSLVGDGGVDVGVWIAALLDGAEERIEPLHALQLLGVAHLRSIKRSAQHADRFVVHLQRHWKRMPVLAAVREREARRILESRRGAVD